jgi:hypothetical protein
MKNNSFKVFVSLHSDLSLTQIKQLKRVLKSYYGIDGLVKQSVFLKIKPQRTLQQMKFRQKSIYKDIHKVNQLIRIKKLSWIFKVVILVINKIIKFATETPLEHDEVLLFYFFKSCEGVYDVTLNRGCSFYREASHLG